MFETILINNGCISAIEYHWERLITSTELIGIKLPFDIQKLTDMINVLVDENKLRANIAVLRLTITDGISERGLLSTGDQEPTFILTLSQYKNIKKKSMTATISTTIKRNENSPSYKIKSISYLDNILAKKEAFSKGFDEAFLLNSKQNVAEGTISNIFIFKNNEIYTPPIISGVLPGVTRNIILNELSLSSVKIMEKNISVDELIDADEVFITNSLFGAMPISKLDNKIYSSSFGIAYSISKLLREKFNYI